MRGSIISRIRSWGNKSYDRRGSFVCICMGIAVASWFVPYAVINVHRYGWNAIDPNYTPFSFAAAMFLSMWVGFKESSLKHKGWVVAGLVGTGGVMVLDSLTDKWKESGASVSAPTSTAAQ